MRKKSFDLEVALDTWRSFFKYRPSFFADDMEELELHLREHIQHLVEAGYSDEEAFREATRKLGGVADLGEEYEQVFWRKIRFRGQMTASLLLQIALIRNYVTTALRNLIKYKVNSALNISGLVFGLTAAFLVFLWVNSEMAVDAFHENADRLFQVKINASGDEGTLTWSNAPAPLAEVLEANFPEIESAILSLPIRASFRKEDLASRELGYFASPAFFEAFTFPLVVGDPNTALTKPGNVVLSERTVEKLFGPNWQTLDSVLGATVSLDNWQSNGGVLGNAVRIEADKELIISGVFANVPTESSMQFDFILPMQEVMSTFGHLSSWGPRWFNLVVLVNEQADANELEEKLQNVLSSSDPSAVNHTLMLQPYVETYLNNAFEDGKPAGGRIQRLYLMGLVGLAILLIACINFTNLLTARSSQRASEIAVRKVVGAAPSSLVQQFLGESIVTTIIAAVGAVVLIALVLPWFGMVTGIQLSLGDVSMGSWLVFAAITICTGLVAGFYPALVLSSTNVTRIIRGNSGSLHQGSLSIRQALVIVQFSISAFLIVGTMTIQDQLDYMRSKDLGMDVGNVVSVRIEGELGSQYEAFRSQLQKKPSVVSVTRSSEHPLAVANLNSNVTWENKLDTEHVLFKVLHADDSFAETMQLSLVEGRFHDLAMDGGQRNYVVNEEAVRALGLDRPIGFPFALGYEVDGPGPGIGRIVGVVKNFHTGSLSEERIGPLVMGLVDGQENFILVRFAPGQSAAGMGDLRKVYQEFNAGYPFEATFLDDTAEEFYANQHVVEMLSQSFALIAIVLACLGLLGLAAFTVQQRTLEIGIRMALGASRPHIIYVLSKELITLVMASLILALPLAWFALDEWLSSFAYRINIDVLTMVAAAGLSIGIAAFTVGMQAVKATAQHPTSLLKS